MPELLTPVVPRGIIVIWHGSLATVPTGWQHCDGTNGTPNLTGRFVIGGGDAYEPGDTGGSNSHSHGIGTITVANSTGNTTVDVTAPTTNVAAHPHSHSISGTTAVGFSMPPYIAKLFIMKM